MRIWSRILIAALAATLAACGPTRPATPVETFKTYTRAVAKKDAAAMKLLLSDATMKMHEQEAKAQGVPIDDIIRRESLFAENQRAVEYKDEKIDGDKATLQVKDPNRKWVTVMFVRENGDWKIDKQSSAEQMMKEIEEEQRRAFEQLDDQNAVPPATPLPEVK